MGSKTKRFQIFGILRLPSRGPDDRPDLKLLIAVGRLDNRSELPGHPGKGFQIGFGQNSDVFIAFDLINQILNLHCIGLGVWIGQRYGLIHLGRVSA